MKNFILKRKSAAARVNEKMEQYQEAVTYAEANMPEEARLVLERAEKEPSIILVLGRDHDFSKCLKDYAIGLAGRLRYEIVAVSTRYIPADPEPGITSYRDKLRQDFSELSEKAASPFREQCEEAGVSFRHLVKFGDATDIIRELHQEFKRLEYVVTEPDESVERADGVTPAIPVFSLAFA